jgi:tetratricopeptide (TPR) repeat protein
MDDIQLANNIYRQAKHYFDRAVMKGRGADIEHTLGVLCLKNGRIKNAVDLFLSAMDKDKSVACDCEIDLGWCALRSGDKALAKKQCYQAAEKTVSRHHAERLKELMLAVEKAYKLQK